MAGFLSPGLGFASSVGAFIGGAARQANANMEAANAQAEQDSKIWAAQFAKGQEAYEKEKKDYNKKSNIYNQFLSAANGNAKAADVAMGAWESNNKDYGSIMNQLANGQLQKSFPTDNNYQSSYMNNLQQGVQSRYDALSNISRAGGAGSMKKYFPMPQAPEFGNRIDFSGNSPSSGNQPMSPQSSGNMPSSQGTNPPNNPYNPVPDQDQVIQPGSPLDKEIGNAPAAGLPIPLDNQDTNAGIAGQQPTKISSVQTGPTQLPHATTQIPTQSGPFAAKGQLTPAQQLAIQQRDRQYNLDVDKFNAQQQQKPESYEAKKDIDAQYDDAKDYLHNNKTGVQARYTALKDVKSSLVDVNSMVNLLNNGLKSSAAQPMFDEMNRFTSSVLGVDLSKLGVSNSVADTNTMRKNIANAVIDRLKTLHFGRITNAEMAMVEQGLNSTKIDPDTNMKIALTLQRAMREELQGTTGEWQAAYGPGAPTNMLQKVSAARTFLNNFANQSGGDPPMPWAVVPNTAEGVNAVPVGQWFETGGHMWIKTPNGLRRAGDNING